MRALPAKGSPISLPCCCGDVRDEASPKHPCQRLTHLQRQGRLHRPRAGSCCQTTAAHPTTRSAAGASLLQVTQLVIQGVHALSNPNAGVVAACPSAQHLVATAANSFAVVYDTSTPAAPVQVQQLRSTTSNQALQCVAWSCCGTHLAAGEGGSNASVFIWDVSSGRCVHELKARKNAVARLCFSPDGRWPAVAVCLQTCPICHHVLSSDVAPSAALPPCAMSALVAGKLLASIGCGADGYLCIW